MIANWLNMIVDVKIVISMILHYSKHMLYPLLMVKYMFLIYTTRLAIKYVVYNYVWIITKSNYS